MALFSRLTSLFLVVCVVARINGLENGQSFLFIASFLLLHVRLGCGHLLQVPSGKGEEPAKVQQQNEEQIVVL